MAASWLIMTAADQRHGATDVALTRTAADGKCITEVSLSKPWQRTAARKKKQRSEATEIYIAGAAGRWKFFFDYFLGKNRPITGLTGTAFEGRGEREEGSIEERLTGNMYD